MGLFLMIMDDQKYAQKLGKAHGQASSWRWQASRNILPHNPTCATQVFKNMCPCCLYQIVFKVFTCSVRFPRRLRLSNAQRILLSWWNHAQRPCPKVKKYRKRYDASPAKRNFGGLLGTPDTGARCGVFSSCRQQWVV